MQEVRRKPGIEATCYVGSLREASQPPLREASQPPLLDPPSHLLAYSCERSVDAEAGHTLMAAVNRATDSFTRPAGGEGAQRVFFRLCSRARHDGDAMHEGGLWPDA